MAYWIIIVIGILILSISLSNPFYNLTIKRIYNFSSIINIIIRVFLFLLSIIIIFLGLYIESLI